MLAVFNTRWVTTAGRWSGRARPNYLEALNHRRHSANSIARPQTAHPAGWLSTDATFARDGNGGGAILATPADASPVPAPDLGERWPSRLVATAEEDRLSTTIWSGGAAAGLYLGTGLILAFLVHTYYPGALGLREWIRVILSWPLIFFLRSK
jgi:hypothetical protein